MYRAVLCYAVCRDRPVCIPTPGVQLVTLSHVEDVASMLATVPGNPAAIRQYYNVCSDRQISFTGDLSGGGDLPTSAWVFCSVGWEGTRSRVRLAVGQPMLVCVVCDCIPLVSPSPLYCHSVSWLLLPVSCCAWLCVMTHLTPHRHLQGHRQGPGQGG